MARGGAAAEPAHVLAITEPLCLAPPAVPPGRHPHHGVRGPRPRALGAVGCAAGSSRWAESQQKLTQVAPPPREAREAGAGVGGVARDAVVDALAAVEAGAQGQAHGGCGHREGRAVSLARGPFSGEALRGPLLLGLRYPEDRPPAGLSSWAPPSAETRPPKPAMNEHTWAGAGASQGFRPPVTRRAPGRAGWCPGGRERGALPEGPSGPEHHQGCGCL